MGALALSAEGLVLHVAFSVCEENAFVCVFVLQENVPLISCCIRHLFVSPRLLVICTGHRTLSTTGQGTADGVKVFYGVIFL
jgi:hypothetical protein